MIVKLFIAIPSPFLESNGGHVSLLIKRKGWFDFDSGIGHLSVGEPSPTIVATSNMPHAHPKAVLFGGVMNYFGDKTAHKFKRIIDENKLISFGDTEEMGFNTLWFGAYLSDIQKSDIRLHPSYGCLDVIGHRHIADYKKKESNKTKRVSVDKLSGMTNKFQSFARASKLSTVDITTHHTYCLQGKELVMASKILDFFEEVEKERRRDLPEIHYADAVE